MRKNQRNNRHRIARAAKSAASRKAREASALEAKRSAALKSKEVAALRTKWMTKRGDNRDAVEASMTDDSRVAMFDWPAPVYLLPIPDSLDDPAWDVAMTLHDDGQRGGGMFNFKAGIVILYASEGADVLEGKGFVDNEDVARAVRDVMWEREVDPETAFRLLPLPHIKVRGGVLYPKAWNDLDTYPGAFFNPDAATEALADLRGGCDDRSIGIRSIKAITEMAKAIHRGDRDDVFLREGRSFALVDHSMDGTRLGGYVGDSMGTANIARGVLTHTGMRDEGFNFAIETNDPSIGFHVPMALADESAHDALMNVEFDGHPIKGVIWRDDFVVAARGDGPAELLTALVEKGSPALPLRFADALLAEVKRMEIATGGYGR